MTYSSKKIKTGLHQSINTKESQLRGENERMLFIRTIQRIHI